MNFEEDYNTYCSERSRKLLGLDKTDPIAFSEQYFGKKGKNLGHLSIDPNANVGGISPNNYLSEMAKPFAKKYFFQKLFEKGKKRFGDDFSLRWIYDGTIYLHDATKLQPYCFGISATEPATLGRPHGNLPAKSPKRLESFMGIMTETIMEMSQEFAGAIAVTDLVPWMAYFIELGKRSIKLWRWKYKIKYRDKEIENIFQSFVHVLNNSFRVGGDSPFTNISVNSKAVYYDIFDHYVFPDGKTIDDLWETIKRVQKIIVKFMGKGQPNGLPYRFPILTANFKADPKEQESDWFGWVTRENRKGFMNINYAERFSMCCRLQLDFSFKQNSFGGGGVKIGSMRVANVNLPRVMYKALEKRNGTYDHQIFTDELAFTIDRSIEYITAYSDIFQEMIDIGYLKFFREPSQWFNKKMFFGTVGFCGIWDAAQKVAYDHDRQKEVLKYHVIGGQFLKEYTRLTVNLMGEICDLFVEKTKEASNGIKFNVEQVPSESAAGRMAKFNADYGEEEEYYSNQFIPLQVDIPLHKRIEYEARLQKKLTGGGMTFINMDSEITADQSYELHKMIMDAGFEGQFCLNYGYTKCNECGKVTYGINIACDCGCTDVQTITRVVGYFAEIHNTAKSKTAEINDRLVYTEI